MRIKKIKVYKLQELSEKSQKKAHWEFIKNDYFPWNDEYSDTLNQFCKIFRIQYRSENDFRIPQEYMKIEGLRILSYLWNNYQAKLWDAKTIYHKDYWNNHKSRKSKMAIELNCFTGFCADYDILDPIADFFKNPNKNISLSDLLYDCIQSLLAAWNKDIEDCQSFEYFQDHCDCNDFEFDEYGNLM